MKLLAALLISVLALAACGVTPDSSVPELAANAEVGEYLGLPEPVLSGGMSVEEALRERRSIREYTGEPLTLGEVGQLLWAAQGVTADWGGRTAPSAGARYPLELYVVAGSVDGLESGVYKYEQSGHQLEAIISGDVREELSAVSLQQNSVRDGAAVFVFSAVYERTRSRYGDRGERYVHIEVGHAAQNLALQAVALDLGCVVVGAFGDDDLKDLLMMPVDESPLYVVPVGRIGSDS